ncbi:competence protein ComK [Alkalibacillus haloalkaliphilus]|uniref:Competence protein n=1 Tax=Alkalibacillus haloalkaliphilus TaxID=94136 RepID=A0A511VZM4_9BACI|nr:competence protein ComK [Alkalibacillus haloalkaliphilus]GEN44245.1 hypothetical protein AHA02nite_00210 [Alkalibacillus haloalkaliphilus]
MSQNIDYKSEYIINDNTMAIKHYDKSSMFGSWILEDQTVYLCRKQPEEILNDSCLKKGLTTLDGRKKAVENLMGRKVRLPVPIENEYNSLFIPTTTRKRTRSDWISYRYIHRFYPNGNDFFSMIEFTNGKTVPFEMTKVIYDKQMLYAGFLLGYFYKKDDIS